MILMKNLFRNEILDPKFSMAIDLFNANNHKEAYEILFCLWKNTKHPSRKLFFQAILQCSAALQLIDQQKFLGARKVYACALRKLINFSSLTKPFNVRRFIFEIMDYFENISFDFAAADLDLPYATTRPRLVYSSDSNYD